jgi:IgGFc binding protein
MTRWAWWLVTLGMILGLGACSASTPHGTGGGQGGAVAAGGAPSSSGATGGQGGGAGGASFTSTSTSGGHGGAATSNASSSGQGGASNASSSASSSGAVCTQSGQACATMADCCTPLTCTGGMCTIPTSTSSGGVCAHSCSQDLHSIVDCHDTTVTTCSATEACDPTSVTCVAACTAAADAKQSVGCEFYATDMDQYETDVCFAAFIGNTWNSAVHIGVDFNGMTLPVGNFAFIPSGTGPSLTYTPYDATNGLAPGQVAILFLAGGTGAGPMCPKATALPSSTAQIFGASGLGHSFHITTDVPVAAYEINPYGGGSAAITGASLLLPTSVWGTNYIAVTVSPEDISGPSMNIIAAEDNTTVTMFPNVAIAGGGGLAAGPANTQYVFTLDKGQMAQFSQGLDLTGTVIQSTSPIGLMAGQPCMRWPTGNPYCDHGEQMVPPISALGSEYVGVQYRPRVAGDQAWWHMIGTIDGTALTYSNAVGGPATLNAGQVVNFQTGTPFDVKSQDSMHPFMLFTYMTGSQDLSDTGGYGDPDFVLSVPPQQYLNNYVFFTDPTYPETDVVVVRRPNAQSTFDDVTLDCAGVLTGWTAVGNYEWTRVDLITGNFQNVGNCSTGLHQISSPTPFGIWVWGWGTPLTSSFTANVSYGYPGGMAAQVINAVVIPPTG